MNDSFPIMSSEQMRQHEQNGSVVGLNEIALMENAGKGVANYVKECSISSSLKKQIQVICGKGNNGGDGFTAAYYLLTMGFEVKVFCPYEKENLNSLAYTQAVRFEALGGSCHFKHSASFFDQKGIIIDALFGTGFKGKIEGYLANVIKTLQNARSPIFSIDIPSGLNSDTGEAECALYATETLFLECPKIGFFLNEGWEHVGKLIKISLGLGQVSSPKPSYFLLTEKAISSLIPVYKRTQHKYSRGTVAGWAGSQGMSGAALLASKAAMRAGAGMVRLCTTKSLFPELLLAPLEVIKCDCEKKEEILTVLNRSSAAFLGPGIGKKEEVLSLCLALLSGLSVRSVIDADALNCLAYYKIAPPKGAVLTPQFAELTRLLGLKEPIKRDVDFLKIGLELAHKWEITLVAKGAPTWIFFPNGNEAFVCPLGNPGMATAGCGDVLTGIIASLIAQMLPPPEAACCGVFLHALAGDLAAHKFSEHSLIASDLIEELPRAYQSLNPTCALHHA